MELITHGAAFVVGGLVTLWGYRRMVKRDPARLEQWLAQARAWDTERRNK